MFVCDVVQIQKLDLSLCVFERKVSRTTSIEVLTSWSTWQSGTVMHSTQKFMLNFLQTRCGTHVFLSISSTNKRLAESSGMVTIRENVA